MNEKEKKREGERERERERERVLIKKSFFYRRSEFLLK